MQIVFFCYRIFSGAKIIAVYIHTKQFLREFFVLLININIEIVFSLV